MYLGVVTWPRKAALSVKSARDLIDMEIPEPDHDPRADPAIPAAIKLGAKRSTWDGRLRASKLRYRVLLFDMNGYALLMLDNRTVRWVARNDLSEAKDHAFPPALPNE
jgi:hypothetical protein